MIQTRRTSIFGRGWVCARAKGCALHDEDVQFSVVVIIKQCNPGTDDLGVVELAIPAVEVSKLNPGGLCRVDESLPRNDR